MAIDPKTPLGPRRAYWPMMRRWLLLAITAVVLALASATVQANAHVLEGPHVLELTAKALGAIPTLQVHQKRLVYPHDAGTPPFVRDESVIYMIPSRFRSEIVSDTSQRIFLEVEDRSVTVVDGQTIFDEDPFDRYQRLIRNRTRPRLMRTLNQMGVETAISSLGRVEGNVVHVLGAHYPDASVTQLAVDQNTFLPVRLLLVRPGVEGESDRFEIFYDNWQPIQRGWFPHQVVFMVNGRLASEIRVVDVRPNPSLPPHLMDIEALQASVAPQEVDASRQDSAGEPPSHKVD